MSSPNSSVHQDEYESGFSAPRSAGSLRSASPFRQASVRLGSPVSSMGQYMARGLSPSRTALNEDEQAVVDDLPSDENIDNTPALSSSYADSKLKRRDSPSVSSFAQSPQQLFNDSSAVSVRSMDIDNPAPEVVKVVGRHLVNDATGSDSQAVDDKFASLKLQGGDITRQLYNWRREHEEGEASTKRGRSRSFDMPRPLPKGPNNEPIDIKNIKAPGGFRRNFIVNKVIQDPERQTEGHPAFLTRNFIEFLSIYGHFAGEDLEEEEEEEEEGVEGEYPEGADERTALLRRPSYRRRKSTRPSQKEATATKAVMLMLKSFVGTGVLFLPKAFYNGGMLFSSLVLAAVSLISYFCFILLINAKDASGVNSFGDVGGALYGPKMRQIILASIVLSQIGFAAAYIVFTSENLQALVLAVMKRDVSIEAMIALQLLIFAPLAMIRDIAKLSGTALIADFFILLGLVYLYYWDSRTLIANGVADIVMFNKRSFTLFIGTAIFTFEGIGLIIPIQESMKRPSQFTTVMGGVMIGITIIFVSMGALSYAAFGSEVKTVVILNLPQDSAFVNGIQLLYSLAILLSTPLQLFPAIRILENGMFVRSGKYSKRVKWEKNIFRFFLVMFTAIVAWGGADDLDRFVSLIGSFACIPLVYIYPPLLHLKACARSVFWRGIDIALVVLGFGAMIYTTAGTLQTWVK